MFLKKYCLVLKLLYKAVYSVTDYKLTRLVHTILDNRILVIGIPKERVFIQFHEGTKDTVRF